MSNIRNHARQSPAQLSVFERGKLEVRAADHEELRETIDLLISNQAPLAIELAIKLEGNKRKLGSLRAYAVLTLELNPDEFVKCVCAQYADPSERFMLAYAVAQRFEDLLNALRKGKTWVALAWFENGLGVTAGESKRAN